MTVQLSKEAAAAVRHVLERQADMAATNVRYCPSNEIEHWRRELAEIQIAIVLVGGEAIYDERGYKPKERAA